MPISEDFALAALRGRRIEHLNVAALAREWGWSQGKVRQQLDGWRKNGDLPPSPPRRTTKRKEAVAVSRPAPALAAAPAASPPASAQAKRVKAKTAKAKAPEAETTEAEATEAKTAEAESAESETTEAKAAEAETAEAETTEAETAEAETVEAKTVEAKPAAPRSRRFGRLLGAISLAGVGVALAGIGMVETTAFAARVGGLLFAALAVCADALVLIMPAAVAALWRRRSPAAIAAAALWLVGGAVSLANLSGYIGSSDEGFTTARTSQALQRSLDLEQLARLRRERAAIAEMRPVNALRVALLNARRSHRPALREALAVATRRDAIDAELSTFAARLPAIPQIATADPSANVLSEITGANVSETSLRRLRLLLLLVLPLCGGFAFSLALSLFRAPQRRAGMT